MLIHIRYEGADLQGRFSRAGNSDNVGMPGACRLTERDFPVMLNIKSKETSRFRLPGMLRQGEHSTHAFSVLSVADCTNIAGGKSGARRYRALPGTCDTSLQAYWCI